MKREHAAPQDRTLLASTTSLQRWLRAAAYEAYDPFDGLDSVLRPFALGGKGRQVLLQGVRRFPLNVRPILGIRPALGTKGAAYIARAHLKLAKLGEPFGDSADVARQLLDWLVEVASPGYSDLCWGNHFDYQSRGFYLPKGEPTVVWTALCGHALLEAFVALGDEQYLEHARSVRRFIVGDLERHSEGRGLCISYIPHEYCAIHNANVLAAGFLARLQLVDPGAQSAEVARAAIAYTAGCQRADGSWWYGEESRYHWVDNFHTGYVLDSLWWYMLGTGDMSFADEFVKGADYWTKHFFREDGAPKYYAHRLWPIDIQCCSQAVETLTILHAAGNPGALQLADRVAEWTITNMQGKDGHFSFRRWPGIVDRTAMLHWGQATMLHALACLMAAHAKADES